RLLLHRPRLLLHRPRLPSQFRCQSRCHGSLAHPSKGRRWNHGVVTTAGAGGVTGGFPVAEAEAGFSGGGRLGGGRWGWVWWWFRWWPWWWFRWWPWWWFRRWSWRWFRYSWPRFLSLCGQTVT